ncbi:post-segregation killing protein PndC [Salmonella enterica]|nr:post-segregation killing protein PndC [Salmonella enterica]ECB3675284.1 post-segregation killing protein PndC [Salmonella enterica subsp. enterica serovar Newport]EAP7508967.1 post-segregation killing protein PndC [Salmonella enterica]EAQ8569896.1 post-segregation killing protein PndC [Salmonella enterica]EAT4222022.1 post-segregation killing protein PndC [Salmonella enterica]
MSTRSTISVLCRDGLVRTVYCHQDSNLQHNGRILAEYYNSRDAAEALVAPGNMHYLRPRCDRPEGHCEETPAEGVTLYYRDCWSPSHIDAGAYHAARVYPDTDTALAEEDCPVIGHHYVYDGSRWFIRQLTVRGWKYRLLRDALRGRKR